MWFIGFFRNVINSLNGLFSFITQPLGEQFPELQQFSILGNASILNLLSISLVAFLGVLLVFHVIRLFIGG